MAFVDPNVYKNLYAISKEELSKRNMNKWSYYEIKMERNIVEKLNNFNPIEG